MTGSGTRKQDSVTASVSEPPLAPKPKRKRKEKSPIKWRRKRTRKADTGSVPVSANPTNSQAADLTVSDPAVTGSVESNSTVGLPQESSVQVEHPLQTQETVSIQDIPVQSDNPLQVDLSACTSPGTSWIVKMKIFMISMFRNFVRTILGDQRGLFLRDALHCRCMLSFCCSVKCQRENWSEHRVACSLIPV